MFEALAERANWLAGDIGADDFGKGLLAAGISRATIASWSSDPQVSCGGERGSLFDLLEDLDADDVLAKVSKIE